MSVTQVSLVQPPTRVPVAARVAQALVVVPLGLLVATACVVFTVTAPPSSLGVGDWAVAAWAVAIAALNVVLGLRVGRGSEPARRALVAVALSHIAFSVVKLTVYEESASFPFMVLDAAVIALLLTPSARHFCRGA